MLGEARRRDEPNSKIHPGDNPACVAAVVDRGTGDVFTGHNQPKPTVADPRYLETL